MSLAAAPDLEGAFGVDFAEAADPLVAALKGGGEKTIGV
jgi:hypothetical protein